MSVLIIIADASLFNNFSDNGILALINKDDFLESSLYAQISDNGYKITDHQAYLFELCYEPMLSDNSMSVDTYMKLYRRYSDFTNVFNLYIASLIEPYMTSYTDLDRRGNNTYVFYCK